MPYDNIISRSDGQALVPEDVSDRLLKGLQNMSAAMTLFPKVPMSRSQQRMPVLSALPTAYFINGDTGLKQTTETAWTNKYLNVEELACIVPIPENVLDDTSFDIWGSVQPLLEEATARALDAAIFFSVNKPASWPTAIVAAAIAAGNTIQRGVNPAAQGGLAGDISDLFATIEADGYDVNGAIANRTYRGILRQVRTTFGQQLPEVTPNEAYGTAITYPMRGLWPTGSGAAEMIVGDFSGNGILGIRKDFTYKVLDQAVIQDNSGAIIYNLAQQDMVALRLTFRCAFQVANLINYDQPNEAVRYPFGVLHAA
jgi:HK97 family phage major capsid protein